MVLHLLSYQSYSLQKTLHYVIGVREGSCTHDAEFCFFLYCSVHVLYQTWKFYLSYTFNAPSSIQYVY